MSRSVSPRSASGISWFIGGLVALVLVMSHASAAPVASTSASTLPAGSESLFPSNPPVDIAGKHGLTRQGLSDEAAAQFKDLCSIAEFEALPQADRHVYSFDPWPVAKDDLQVRSYSFNFLLGGEGVTSQKVTFSPSGGGPGSRLSLTRAKEAGSSQYVLKGLGNLDWGAGSTHTFLFDRPVAAFGVVLRSSGDVELRRFLWPGAKDNGYPVSYTLADGSVIQLGERELRGALIKGDSKAFLGVIDRSGRGIVSISYMLRGLAGNKAQSISMCQMAFATVPRPAVASVISLRSSCDFDSPGTITASPAPRLSGLASLDAFRFIVANHRYVYRFDTWPLKAAAFASNAAEFCFDLKGKGAVDQKVRLAAANSANSAQPTQTTVRDKDGQPYHVLGGLGDVGDGKWAEQTFTFEKPVWGFGVTYRSPGDLNLAKAADYPVSYRLSDGTVINLGTAGGPGGTIAADGKTFVGVIDGTDKGISSITVRVQGTAKGSQPVLIEDLAFALAGPPPGNWKLTLEDHFDGNALNPKIWTPGYTFKDVINNELQGYVPENIAVSKGLCTIKVEQRDCANTDRLGRRGPTQKFASAAFTSYDKFTQTYGYFEARIRMPRPRGAGVWPAFWMLPDRGAAFPETVRTAYLTKENGRGMEIDVFEFMPFWQRQDGLFPLHVGCIWNYGKVTPQAPAPHGYGNYALDNDGWGPKELDFPELDTQFHTYGLYWSPQRLIWYVDSRPIYRVRDPKHVPNVPHYFLFNVALSGNGWGKTPGGKNPTFSDIAADLPNQMEIDYFRAYSGTLEEAVPTPPEDVPTAGVTRYTPPANTTQAVPSTKPATAPAEPAKTPAAPVNSQISSPSNG